MLEEYLYIDRVRVRSYAEQIGAATTAGTQPRWKVGLAWTGPSAGDPEPVGSRSATDHEMIMAIVDYLRTQNLLLTARPGSVKEAEDARDGFVLETMSARKVVFRCDPKSPPGGLREIAVWVSNPLKKPSEVREQREARSEPFGMFVYLIEGYWENEEFHRASSMFTALNVLLEHLRKIGAGEGDRFDTSRDDYASPVAILERAGGVKGETRDIRTLYRIRSVSDNQIVSVGGETLRCYDLFGYPVFIALELGTKLGGRGPGGRIQPQPQLSAASGPPVVTLDGKELEALRDALCSAFDQDSLDQMLRTRLNLDRAQWVGPGSLRVVVYRLIQLAVARGWVTDLIRVARNDNPGNPALRKFCEDHPRLMPPQEHP
jgi:hypothetical protein